MSTIDPVSSATSGPAANDVDVEAFGMNTVLTLMFQDMLEQSRMDDDDDSIGANPADSVNQSMAAYMANVGSGFGV